MSNVAINEDLLTTELPVFGEERASDFLSVVPRKKSRRKLLFGVIGLLGALVIVAIQMSLSIVNMQTSYEIQALTSEKSMVAWESQMMYDEIAGLSSPQYLAANATALGMVINESPSFLRLSDGALIGSTNAAIESSSVNVFKSTSVANDLIAQTPLVTAPGFTMGGPKLTDPVLSDPLVVVSVLEGGLPTPVTR